ncbi:WhiB family transcriptional regulator [Rhodococcus sp. As11]|uniref:WhiB family transcriptional regulator n=1 Tax=Rhodococcus sp. As11 TaxID=3029189 RepID=UPI003B821673
MTRRSTSRIPAIPPLLERLIDPRLTGARCAGRAPWFDAELDDETTEQRSARLAWARRQCRECPVASACRTAGLEQDRALGVWAGRVHGLPGRPGRGQSCDFTPAT